MPHNHKFSMNEAELHGWQSSLFFFFSFLPVVTPFREYESIVSLGQHYSFADIVAFYFASVPVFGSFCSFNQSILKLGAFLNIFFPYTRHISHI